MRYKNIAEYLKSKGMTETELAEKAGVTQACINQIKTGKRTPSWRVALRLKEITGIPLERLIGQQRASA
jgi:DNA-binding XRE family transcriptional regulator